MQGNDAALQSKLALEQRLLSELEARVTARDRPLHEEQHRLDTQLGHAKAQREQLEAARCALVAQTKALEAQHAQLENGLTAWQRSVARLFEPALAAAALFVGLAAWGLAPVPGVAVAEALGCLIGVVLALQWRRRG